MSSIHWNPINKLKCADGTMLMYRESGGGGNCMFHSIAASMSDGSDYMTIRHAAASSVTALNAPDVLMDMAAQCPKTLDVKMDVPRMQSKNTFSPETVWNNANGSQEEMALELKKAICTPGNYMWGDATVASLVESALNVNVMLLAAYTGSDISPTEKEHALTRAVFAGWVVNVIATYPELNKSSAKDVLAFMTSLGLGWNKALSVVCSKSKGTRTETGLRGYRQPIGTIRELVRNPNAGNISMMGYMNSRPNIIIWNISNVHWVPVGVGSHAITKIDPNSPLRAFVDGLMA